MEGDRFRSIFILIYVDIQFSKNWLLKMLIFLQFMFWHHSQISDGCSYKHLHLDFLFYFIVLHFYFVSIYLCFYCYTFVIYWYMEWPLLQHYSFFFQNYLGCKIYFFLLFFFSFSIPVKNTLVIVIRITLNLKISFGSMVNLQY